MKEGAEAGRREGSRKGKPKDRGKTGKEGGGKPNKTGTDPRCGVAEETRRKRERA